ncbi:MAG: hypothetical protein ACFFDN_05285 [Candidatus Hodarchaeota archaeon]
MKTIEKELFEYFDNFFHERPDLAPSPNQVKSFIDISENLTWEEAAFSQQKEPSNVAKIYKKWHENNF